MSLLPVFIKSSDGSFFLCQQVQHQKKWISSRQFLANGCLLRSHNAPSIWNQRRQEYNFLNRKLPQARKWLPWRWHSHCLLALAGQESFGLYSSADYFCPKPSSSIFDLLFLGKGSDIFRTRFIIRLIPDDALFLFRTEMVRSTWEERQTVRDRKNGGQIQSSVSR